MMADDPRLYVEWGRLTNLYEQARAAAALLGDVDWLAKEFGGNEWAARDSLEGELLAHTGGALTLGELLAVYRTFPDGAIWEKHQYDVRRLWADRQAVEADARKEESGRVQARRGRTPAEQLQALWDGATAAERKAFLEHNAIRPVDETEPKGRPRQPERN